MVYSMFSLRSILLIDDSPAARFLHASLIEDLQLAQELLVAANGRDGMALFDKKAQAGAPPELVLLDLKMPVMDGFDFLNLYRQKGYAERYRTLLAVLTTSSDPRDVWHLQQFGFAQYVPKPLIPEDLKALASLYQGRTTRRAV